MPTFKYAHFLQISSSKKQVFLFFSQLSYSNLKHFHFEEVTFHLKHSFPPFNLYKDFHILYSSVHLYHSLNYSCLAMSNILDLYLLYQFIFDFKYLALIIKCCPR